MNVQKIRSLGLAISAITSLIGLVITMLNTGCSSKPFENAICDQKTEQLMNLGMSIGATGLVLSVFVVIISSFYTNSTSRDS